MGQVVERPTGRPEGGRNRPCKGPEVGLRKVTCWSPGACLRGTKALRPQCGLWWERVAFGEQGTAWSPWRGQDQAAEDLAETIPRKQDPVSEGKRKGGSALGMGEKRRCVSVGQGRGAESLRPASGVAGAAGRPEGQGCSSCPGPQAQRRQAGSSSTLSAKKS